MYGSQARRALLRLYPTSSFKRAAFIGYLVIKEPNWISTTTLKCHDCSEPTELRERAQENPINMNNEKSSTIMYKWYAAPVLWFRQARLAKGTQGDKRKKCDSDLTSSTKPYGKRIPSKESNVTTSNMQQPKQILHFAHGKVGGCRHLLVALTKLNTPWP